MNNRMIIGNIADRVKEFHANDSTGHDWWHVHRVWGVASRLAGLEGANPFVVQLAALLHDTDDWKLSQGMQKGNTCPNARAIMQAQGIAPDIIERVVEIIGEVSFRGALVETIPTSIEACVVQDADRMDAMGAIGIARAFAYGGSKGRSLYDPERMPSLHATFDDYKNSKSTTLNHFYEKLLLLYSRLNTKSAQKMARARHDFLELFVRQFLDEWKETENTQRDDTSCR